MMARVRENIVPWLLVMILFTFGRNECKYLNMRNEVESSATQDKQVGRGVSKRSAEQVPLTPTGVEEEEDEAWSDCVRLVREETMRRGYASRKARLNFLLTTLLRCVSYMENYDLRTGAYTGTPGQSRYIKGLVNRPLL